MIAIKPIHNYTEVVLGFFGRFEEEKNALEGQLRILRGHHGNINHVEIAAVLRELGRVYKLFGKLQESFPKQLESLEMFHAIPGNDSKKSFNCLYPWKSGHDLQVAR